MALHSCHIRLPLPPRQLDVVTTDRRRHLIIGASSSSVSSSQKARFSAKRSESIFVQQLQRPLVEYMGLPVSQYSVLDAQRIERVDENTFRCYVYQLKFLGFEVCPVLLVRVEQEPYGCCIRLLSCKDHVTLLYKTKKKLELLLPKESFDIDLVWENAASMVNKISCGNGLRSGSQQLTSDTSIEVLIDIPFAFRLIPKEVIESTGAQVLEQLLRVMLPRFLKQLNKDYQAWASGDASRQPLGTGEI